MVMANVGVILYDTHTQYVIPYSIDCIQSVLNDFVYWVVIFVAFV